MSNHPSFPILFVVIIFMTGCVHQSVPVRVYFVAGQSNAVGYDGDASKLTVNPIDREVLFWYRTGSMPLDENDSRSPGWTTLGPQPRGAIEKPHSNFRYEYGFGPEIGFGRTLAEQCKDKVAIFKFALNGSALHAHWKPIGNDGFLQALIDHYRHADTDLREMGWDPVPSGLLWMQGESDAADETASEIYDENLEALVDRLRREFHCLLPVVIPRIYHKNRLFADKVRSAQSTFAESDDLTVCFDTDDLERDAINQGHYNWKGLLQLGIQAANIIRKD